MTNTYSYGTRKRTGCPHGHCYICGYDNRTKGYKKTELKRFMKFHILPFVNDYLNDSKHPQKVSKSYQIGRIIYK